MSVSKTLISGLVFNIQRFSVHDGPGIRTTVFLKGCSLRCYWCQNPEGLHPRQEVQYFPELCIGCGECVDICERQGHQINEDGHIFLRENCTACGACIAICYAGALRLIGSRMSVEQVMVEILRDHLFYKNSGGGVTLSGGDPLFQPDFARAILEQCKIRQIHTAMETAISTRWEILESLLPLTDLFFVDIKHFDPEKHFEATGTSNTRILENIKRLVQTDKPIVFRIPVVPEFNDTAEDISAIARYIHQLSELRNTSSHEQLCSRDSISLELIAFHTLASDKYRSLGLDYLSGQQIPPSREKINELRQVAAQWGIVVHGLHSQREKI